MSVEHPFGQLARRVTQVTRHQTDHALRAPSTLNDEALAEIDDAARIAAYANKAEAVKMADPVPGDILVLSGGGLLGAIQAGMLQSLVVSGWQPEQIVGVSAGALNGTWLAAGFDPGRAIALSTIWRSLKGKGVFPAGTAAQVFKILTKKDSIQSNEALSSLIARCCPVDDLTELLIRTHVGATNVKTGEADWFSTGNAHQRLLASAAIPGIVPPVHIDGVTYVDGGVRANVPLSRAVDLGAKRILCLDVSGSNAAPNEPKTALNVLLRSFAIARTALVEAEFEKAVDSTDRVWRIRPEIPAGLGTNEWDRTDELIQLGWDTMQAWLTEHRHELARPEEPVPHKTLMDRTLTALRVRR